LPQRHRRRGSCAAVSERYNSTQAGGRENFGAGGKFITPTTADGMVFVGTTNGVAVFDERWLHLRP